ncbi:regulator of microtubule dynamics protein 1-like [Hydractinia symbiolongicarpus]|uniref:regulator of microtubule dynamics protein 1-like n=1 Tax=Hydractinia symbiolongicarpus TaxID=13093 RepID=UPI00254B60A1|nr:regulator of microtubule dynamics protein 1-like [Hydractinia symbiolongicarpus]
MFSRARLVYILKFQRVKLTTFYYQFRRVKPILNQLYNSIVTQASFISSIALFSSAFVLQAAAQESQKNMSEITKAEELYDQNDFKGVYEYLLQFKDSNNPELLWRLVRGTRDRAGMADVSKEEKKKMIFEAFEVAKQALELGDDNYACHKWYGIMLSQTGDYIGTKKKIEDSPVMKKHFERAIELCPTDATSHHLIGMWCFSFADLAWYERKIAAVVFGSPPESTYEEALSHFKEAESLSPSFYSTNQYMIALVLLKMGKKSEAKEWFQKLSQFKVIKEEDKENVKKAQTQMECL